MKKITLTVFLISLTLAIFAQEKLTIIMGDSTNITLPFVIEKYELSTKDFVVVTSLNDTQLSLTGKKQGECTLKVLGGGITKSYHLTIVGNTRKIMNKLRSDLQEISELSIYMNQDVIVIKGNISRYEKWELLKKVLQYYKSEKIQNYAKFVPAAETLISLKKTFSAMGYEFTDSKELMPGYLNMRMSPDTFFLSGQVFSEGERNEIMAVLKNQKWLSLGNTTNFDEQIRGIVNISVVKTQIAVDVAFIAISKGEADKLGSSGTLNATTHFAAIYDILTGKAPQNQRFAQFGGDMNRTISFLANNGITRIHKAGTITFTNNTPEGGFIKIGGTNYIRVSGVGGGDVKEVNYGFIVTIKGSVINRRQIDLNLNLENSHMSGELSKKDNSIKTSRIIDFDKTAIVGGFQEVTQNISNSGLPILRNTPVLKWFVAEEEDEVQKADLLILACPRIYKESQIVQMEIPLTEKVAPIVKDVKKSNSDYKDSQKKYSGWLYWMNWFVW